MRKITVLLFVIFLFLNNVVISQTSQKSATNLNVENAEYLKEDLTKLLQRNVKYPVEALRTKIEGDVILSFIIDKTGKIDSLNLLDSPNKILSASSIVSVNHIENEWSPCKINGNPIDKKYFIVFKYRIYMNIQPPEYQKRAEKFARKQKYEKALKYYDKAIVENRFDYKLFKERAKIKEILGDVIGAQTDSLESTRIQNEIISLVDVKGIGVTRVVKRIIYK